MQKKDCKIAVDIREIKYNQITGIGRYVKNFLDNIGREEKKNIHLLADNDTNIAPYRNLFKTIILKAPFTLWYDQIVIPKILKKKKIDIYFSPYYKLPLLSKCKKILTIHDLHFLAPLLRKGISTIKPFSAYLKMALKQADKIITVSEFSKAEILRQFNISSGKNIEVIYLGVDEKFKPLNKERADKLKEIYGIDSRYILYLGNMKPHKNIKGLIEAYSLLDGKVKKDYKLIIVAKKDDNFSELRKLVENLSLNNNIMFFDFVPDDDLVLFYNLAEVFVFPSFYEGFGLPPLEAMACGTPVISSYTTSLREVLGDSALYIDPYNTIEISQKISRILNDNELKDKLKSQGLLRAKKYDPAVFSGNLLEAIESV
jgi:glycosyltransferase involved in cell wall biosynthesis